MDQILTIIERFGFPIAMCVWFMVRLEKKLDELDSVNHKQVVLMAVLVRILADRKNTAVPESLFEEVTGVTEIPMPGDGTRGAIKAPIEDKAK